MVFSTFCQGCDLIHSNFNISTVDRLFISANFQDKSHQDGAVQNSQKELIRFEFFEVLVRIARAKLIEPGTCKNYEEAMEVLFNDFLMNYPKPQSWQQWRDDHLWTLDVNDVFEANLDKLKTIYQSTI